MLSRLYVLQLATRQLCLFVFLVLRSRQVSAQAPSRAEEVITLFNIQARMLKSGVLDIKENITVQARNRLIERRWLRNLPRLWVRPARESRVTDQ